MSMSLSWYEHCSNGVRRLLLNVENGCIWLRRAQSGGRGLCVHRLVHQPSVYTQKSDCKPPTVRLDSLDDGRRTGADDELLTGVPQILRRRIRTVKHIICLTFADIDPARSSPIYCGMMTSRGCNKPEETTRSQYRNRKLGERTGSSGMSRTTHHLFRSGQERAPVSGKIPSNQVCF